MSRPCIYALLSSFLWLLAACSSAIEAPASVPAGYIVVAGEGVALALPTDWEAINPQTVDLTDLAQRLQTNNPAQAERVAAMAEDMREDTFRLAAYHEDGVSTISITSERVSPVENTANHAAANRDGLEALGYVILSTETVSLNGQTAEQTEAAITLTSADNTPFTLNLLQYTLVKGGRAYSLSFGTMAFQMNEFRPQFEQIAQTFHTLDD